MVRILEDLNPPGKGDEFSVDWLDTNHRKQVPLIEQNTQLLASREQEWGDLGRLRRIQFHGRFVSCSDEDPDAVPPRKMAEAFAAQASEQGCECDISRDQYGYTWYVTATMKMEPTAANITSLQERLCSFAEAYSGGYLDGWNYPPKREIRFWPHCSASNKQSASARAAVLFGSELVADPFRNRGDPPPLVFKLEPSQFLRRAKTMPPESAEPTASAFSQWVYSLYGVADGSDEDREQGKAVEEQIWERRRVTASCIDNKFLRSSGSDWRLLHNGLHFHDRTRPKYFEIDQLKINGVSLRVSPDLLYVNEGTSEVSIVEIKYSRLPIPKNLWPNVWAQLWCYSMISTARSAQKVTAIGEVWSEKWSKGYGRGRNRVDGQKLLCLRAAVKRNPRAPAYDRFFRDLFAIYSGQG